jgi:hypothetical protein
MQTAYKYPESAYETLPCGGRALRPGAEIAPAVERHRGGEPRAENKPKGRRTQTGYGVSPADQEAADRETGGPATKLKPTRNTRCLSDQPQSRAMRSLIEVESWLRDPATHALGERVLVSTRVHRSRTGPPRLEVRCTPCGRKQMVNARMWCLKSDRVGKVCVECAVKRRRSMHTRATITQAAS